MKRLDLENYLEWRKMFFLLILLNSLLATNATAQCVTVDCSGLDPSPILQCQDDLPSPDPLAIVYSNACGTVSISSDDVVTTVLNGCPTIERTYTITDDVGSPTDTSDDVSFTCVQSFTITDTEMPIISSGPNNLTVEYTADADALFQNWVDFHGYTSAFDNCGNLTWTSDPANPALTYTGLCTGSGTVLFSVSDQCGNVASVTANYTVEDTTAPVIDTNAADEFIECNGEDHAAAFQDWLANNGGAVASDLCDVSWSTDPAVPEFISYCGGTINTPVTFIASDDAGNTASTTAAFRVVDTTDPIWDSVPEDITISCTDNVIFGNPTASDACSNATITFVDSETPGNFCDGSMVVTRTWTVFDECQLTTNTVAQNITILDQEAPVLTAVHPMLVGLNNNDVLTMPCDDVTIFAATDFVAEDNCDLFPTIEMLDPIISAPGCTDGSTSQILCIWTATDNCGNESSFTITIDIRDDVPPVLSNLPADQIISCTDPLNYTAPTATDNCDDNVMMSFADTENIVGCTYNMTRTWTFTDHCGNESTATQTFTYVDDAAPVFTSVPADQNIECDQDALFGTPAVSDVCTSAAITFEDTMSGDGICTTTYTRTWTASDECGNTSTAAQTITANDTTAPVFTSVPADHEISCTESVVFGDPAIADNCNTYNLTFEDTVIGDLCSGMHTRVWTATDVCGNASTAAQTISVVDTEAPMFTFVPQDEAINCDQAVVFGTPTAEDNCNGATITFTDAMTGNGTCQATHTRTWTATDACGLSTTAAQTITVTDVTAPMISGIDADMTISCTEDPSFAMPVAEDDCNGATITFEDTVTGSGSCMTSYTRIWTATDACGNASTAEQTIVAQDIEAPIFTVVPADETIDCSATPVFGTPEFTENCSEPVDLSFVDTETNDGCTTTTTRTWTATDLCGNSSTAAQVISATDTTLPVFDFVPFHSQVPCYETIQFGEPTVSDDCSTPTVTFEDSPLEGTAFYGFNQTRTWTVTDACGNSATASQQVWIAGDMTPPVFTYVPEPPTFICGEEIILDDAIAVDSCSDVTITFEDVDNGGNCEFGIDITRTWTATDAAGNTATVSITFWVVPVNPVMQFSFIPESYITQECDLASAFGTPIPENNCLIGEIVMEHADERTDGNCAGNFAVTRTWTATDNCGALATCSQTITVEDIEAPAFTNMPPDQTISCTEANLTGEPVAIDNCNGGAVLNFTDDVITIGCTQTITRTWTATDDCGNARTAVQMITMTDNTMPYFETTPVNQVIACGDVADETAPVAADDCTSVTVSFQDTEEGNGCTDGRIVIRLWTAADECGNMITAEQRFEYLPDTEAPVFESVAPDMEIACGDMISIVEPLVSDCGAVTVTFADDVVPMECGIQHTRIWTAVDACGNEAQQTQVITELDNVAPVFTFVPVDATIDCAPAMEFGMPEYEDACSNVSISFTDTTTPGDCQNDYTMTRDWIIVDGCGNMNTASQTITVNDITGPVFTNIVEDQVLGCTGQIVFDMTEATDNCGNVVLTFEDSAVMNECEEVHTRTWTAIDDCDNVSTMVQTITKVDAAAPIFTFVPPSNSQICGDPLEFGEPAIRDFCSQPSWSFVDTEESIGCETTITRVWSAIDACGNVSTAETVITLIDDSAPVFEFVPEDKTIECSVNLTFEAPDVYDYCSGVDLSFVDAEIPGDLPNDYQIIRTWTAIDACGNVATASQAISVEDTKAPFFLFAPTAPIEITPREWSRSWRPPVFVKDNCTETTLVGPSITRASHCRGILLTYSYTAIDSNGNTSSIDIPVIIVVRGEWHCHTITTNNEEWITGGDDDLTEILTIEPADLSIAPTGQEVNTQYIKELSVYPNPASDQLSIKYLSNQDNLDTEIAIYDIIGNQVFTKRNLSQKGENNIQLDVTKLVHGNYIIRMTMGDQHMTRKLMIVK